MLFFIPIFALLLLFGHHELLRFQDAKINCFNQQQKDVDLLSRDVCSDPHDKIQFQGLVDCDSAQQRLRLTIIQCALQSYLRQSIINEWYQWITNSYYTVLFCSMIIIIWYMWLWSKRKSESHALDRMEKIAHQYRLLK